MYNLRPANRWTLILALVRSREPVHPPTAPLTTSIIVYTVQSQSCCGALCHRLARRPGRYTGSHNPLEASAKVADRPLSRDLRPITIGDKTRSDNVIIGLSEYLSIRRGARGPMRSILHPIYRTLAIVLCLCAAWRSEGAAGTNTIPRADGRTRGRAVGWASEIIEISAITLDGSRTDATAAWMPGILFAIGRGKISDML